MDAPISLLPYARASLSIHDRPAGPADFTLHQRRRCTLTYRYSTSRNWSHKSVPSSTAVRRQCVNDSLHTAASGVDFTLKRGRNPLTPRRRRRVVSRRISAALGGRQKRPSHRPPVGIGGERARSSPAVRRPRADWSIGQRARGQCCWCESDEWTLEQTARGLNCFDFRS